MSANNIHDEWLSLVEISGPFLAPPVLKEAFPQGLDLLDPAKRKRLRQTYEEWREALDSEDPEFIKLHQAWIKEVISSCLGFDEDGRGAHLKFGSSVPQSLAVQIPEQGVTLTPEYVLVDEQHDNKPLLLIQSYVNDIDLQAAMSVDGWPASPADRMVQLCRLTGCRLGLVTDGERWMLIDAPVGGVTTFASWYARLWIQEPITLQAFVHLLGIRRFFVAADQQIPALIDKSLQHQDEVTTALGEQVQRAVEVLIQSLDRADQDRNRELLKDVTPAELYEAGLTVMMRLVFLLSAEERGLLLMGDECYEENYAISTLRMQLRSESEEILERRWDAWSRVLSVFRAVYGGIDHENMRLPALGGSLFDPDQFPFLEGRAKGSDWHKGPAKPLPIDNRTVLLLLEAIQQYQGRSLSYRALDVEQIGYVYEGLLERTVKRTSEVILDVGATRSAEKPLVSLAELESLNQSDESALVDYLVERTGSSVARVRNALAKPIDDQLLDRLLATCLGNIDLRNQIRPYANLLRIDPWGYPLIYPADSFVVALGSDRRETGSHYTPKSLTEAIVVETLTPIVYIGPAEGLSRNEWRLKSPADILNLKICDPAMGSGAFLVQACRWLADCLISAWALAELNGKSISSNGDVLDVPGDSELISLNLEERIIKARSLIAERCLYGVDLNSLAVELAKLSIWLMTMSKDRPFGFLDHNLRSGDSLLGVDQLSQLTELDFIPTKNSQKKLFGKVIVSALNDAIQLRRELRSIPIRDIRDIQAIEHLDKEARQKLKISNLIANAFIGIVYSEKNRRSLDRALVELSEKADMAVEGHLDSINSLLIYVENALTSELSGKKVVLKPFHWPLEFPEVFISRDKPGFDAMIANPPYSGGKKIAKQLGANYRQYLLDQIALGRKGSADLCAYFLLRISSLVAEDGKFGVVATSSIAEGDSREVALDFLIDNGCKIYFAHQSLPWPGKASVTVTPICIAKGNWSSSSKLNSREVSVINSYLYEGGNFEGKPIRLKANSNIAFIGTFVHGTGFVLSDVEAANLVAKDSKNAEVIFPYLRGEDFNSSPTQTPSTYVINFRDWPIEKAECYPDCLEILKLKVKPIRDAIVSKGGQIHEYDYWKFWDKRLESYEEISRNERVLFHSFTSKYVAFSFVDVGYIFAAPHVVINLSDFGSFALLQSNIHEVWVRRYTSYSLSLARYTPTDCLETFPIPVMSENAAIVGENYFNLRQKICINQNIGLVDLYNKLHSSLNVESDIVRLRELQVLMDKEIINLYGWGDIDLNHQFYETPRDGVRYTIAPDARIELLQRLLILNNQLSKEAVDLNLVTEASKKTLKTKSKIKAHDQHDLFGDGLA